MFHAVMVELADTIDLGSIGATRTGSSPANRIKPIVIPAMGFSFYLPASICHS